MEASAWFIKNTDFSEGLNADDKAIFMKICPEKRYRKGDFVFRVGDAATDLHVIAKGQVKLVTITSTGNERILAICGPDDFIGEAFLKANSSYRVDAIALTEVVTCPINRLQFQEMARHAPHFVTNFAEVLASHLFTCREMLSTAYDPIKTRVVKALLDLTRRFGKPLQDGWYKLETELRHEELASLTSSTRVSVTMAFAELRDQGFIEGTRGQYMLNVIALSSFEE